MSTVTRLYLIRHGATTLSAEDRFAGSVDVDISDEGRRQAERPRRSARRRQGRRRVLQSAAALRRHGRLRRRVRTGLTPIVRDGLREIAHGRWEGLRRNEVERSSRTSTRHGRPTRSRSRPKAANRACTCWRGRCPFIREIVVAHPAPTSRWSRTRRRSAWWISSLARLRRAAATAIGSTRARRA
jgi:probable phosphoglycerate mutase